MSLKILSWNIWFHADLKKVNDFLENFNGDILGLQEVTMVDKKVQVSKRLTDELGYKYVYAPAFQFPLNGVPTNIGNAIYSKYPIIESYIHNLSENENRIAVQADVQIGSKTLHVFNTHLLHTHQQPSELQDLQAANLAKVLYPSYAGLQHIGLSKQLRGVHPEQFNLKGYTRANSFASGISPRKTVLMGDFNALPQSNVIRIISKVLKNTDPNSLPTWSVYPEGCGKCSPKGIIYKLDNIFTSQDIKGSAFKVEKSQASDHLPISAVVELW